MSDHRFYWRLRAAWARYQLRKYPPRPSTDELLRRIGARCGDPQCEQEGYCMGHMTARKADDD